MARLLRRLSLTSIGLVCLASAGCMQLPIFVPEFNAVPSVNAGCEGAEVHAFRVNVTDKMELKDGPAPNYLVRGENFENFELVRIEPSPTGTTPRQVALTCTSGWCYVGLWNNISSLTSHSVAVRLYRRGCATIALKAGEEPSQLSWVEANDLAGQAKAVDDLLGVSPLERVDTKSSQQQRRLDRGTKSAAHREALLFAAGEYERLARQGEADEDAPALHLAEKAQRLRALADGK